MSNFAEIRERAEKAAEATGGEWILGGCSGRMITTPDGYVGDGFIADVDIKENANHIATANPLTVIALLDHIDKLTAIVNAAIADNKSYPIPTNQAWAAEIKEEMRQNYVNYQTLLKSYMKEAGISED
jgi:hypothetical protein